MNKTDIKKSVKSDDKDKLIEEQRKKIFELQLEVDVLKTATEVLKNYPALNLEKSLKDLTNKVK